MHGGNVNKQLPARPNLDHLRKQAKTLLAELKKGDSKLKLADAQLVVARQNGFASWPRLARHVEHLRALEGEWHFASLEIDGNVMPGEAMKLSRILMDGDRFRTESPEADYEGIFTIDAEQSPAHIDIEFVSGPEAGETCHGIYALEGEELVLCLGLVGSSRPEQFATRPGSGCALERLQRASKARPANVTGGTPPPPAPPVAVDRGDPAAFEVPMTPLLERLQGEWSAIELITDGKSLPEQWLAHGVRRMKGNELEVVFGGQKMVHAKVRIDERARPIAIDYLSLSGKTKGTVTYGIMEWIGEDARFLMAPAGAPRPAEFAPGKGTLSRWRKRA
jgi:uncharacterized protein (TIGR03067 family)